MCSWGCVYTRSSAAVKQCDAAGGASFNYHNRNHCVTTSCVVHCGHARIKLSRYYLQQQSVGDCGDYKVSRSHLLSPQKSVCFYDTCWGEKCAVKNLRISHKRSGQSCLVAAAPDLVLIQPNCQKWLLPAQAYPKAVRICLAQSCTVGAFVAG